MPIALEKNGDKQVVDTEKQAEALEQVGYERLGEVSEESLEKNTNQTKNKPQSNEPLWSKRIPISQQRNLQVVIWPGREGKDPSIALEEGKKEGDQWVNKRIYLSTAKAFEIAERIKQAAFYVRDQTSTS